VILVITHNRDEPPKDSEFELFTKCYWGNQIKEDEMGGAVIVFCHPHNMK